MVTQLLATKLYIPPLRPELVPRPRLIERLNESSRSGHKLMLVSAPAGFGKTTLVVEWLRQTDQPFAWLSLDEGDNDPVRFFTYLLVALQRVDPDIGKTAQAMLQAAQPPPPEPLLTGLINDIAETPHPFIFVLDDYHTINTQSIHDSLAFLLEHLAPQMHLIIAARADPPLPIARLRGRGQLTELHAADLRFTTNEVGAFLNEMMGLALSAKHVAALERRTEGWIAGLQLAALSMQGRDDVSGFIQAFTGSHRYVLDYLTEEVLNRQSKDIQAFLLQTAILDTLTGSLCDVVTGRADSHRTLEALEAANLFLIPLDEERRWYRYHHLFADLLRHHLQRERSDLVPELHRRASAWYEENGLIPEAVSHALASGDAERAAGLIEWTAWLVLTRGEMTTLLGWLDALPNDLVRSRPLLGVLRAWALAFKGEWDGVESQLQEIDVQPVAGDVAAVRAYAASIHGDVPSTIRFAQEALELLAEEKWFSRGIVALSLGIAYQSSGELVAAGQALTKAIAFSLAAGQRHMTMVATAILGQVQEMQGRLRQAIQTHREALELASDTGSRPVPVACMAYVGIAEPLYEWNDLDGAMRYAMQGIKLSELGGFVSYALAGHAILAQVYQAQGDVDSALEVIQKAERLAHRHDYAYVMAVVAELRARLWVARGNVAAASRWAREHRLSAVDDLGVPHEIEQMAVARVLIAEGQPGEALRLLALLLEVVEAAGRIGSMIKILALQAHAFQAQGDVDPALSALERALSLAEPEGYVRTFVDEGEPMARLLRRAMAQGIAPNYVSKLLAAFGEAVEPPPSVVQPLIEPLSERELEVLRLIAAGLSNREIAQELVVAVSTVKSHINHIYGKLAVTSRTQAVAKAQALDLL